MWSGSSGAPEASLESPPSGEITNWRCVSVLTSGSCASFRDRMHGVCCNFLTRLTVCSLRTMREGSFEKILLGQRCSRSHIPGLIKLLKNKCPGTWCCWYPDGPSLLSWSHFKSTRKNVWSQKLYPLSQQLHRPCCRGTAWTENSEL